MRDIELLAPETRAEVLGLLADADEETRLLAGGTGLLNLIKQRLASPERLISLHKVDDLGGIDWSDEGVTIGALEHLLELEHNPTLRDKMPILHQVLAEIASPRIRSMATLGGALGQADPNQDLPLALLALDACVIAESSGARQEIPIDDFYADYYETSLAPDQMVTALHVPLPSPASRFHYKKFTPGSLEDYACVGVCVRIDLDENGCCSDSRIVLGSVAPTIFRSHAAEAKLAGQAITPALAAEVARIAASETDPVDDTRGSAEYKSRMARVWLQRALLAVVA